MIKESDNINSETVANFIFAREFSIEKLVQNISGCDVGMDTVKHLLESEGCSIKINVVDSSMKELTFSPVEFIITLPSNLFQYMGGQ